jgi:hypothetical protein
MSPGLSFLPSQAGTAAQALLCVASFLVLFLFGGSKNPPERKVIVPSAGRPIPPSANERAESLMRVVRQLESYLDRISEGGVQDEERKWQNKLRAELDGIKRSAASGDYAGAKRRLSSAELYVKMLELHMAGR